MDDRVIAWKFGRGSLFLLCIFLPSTSPCLCSHWPRLSSAAFAVLCWELVLRQSSPCGKEKLLAHFFTYLWITVLIYVNVPTAGPMSGQPALCVLV